MTICTAYTLTSFTQKLFYFLLKIGSLVIREIEFISAEKQKCFIFMSQKGTILTVLRELFFLYKQIELLQQP